MQAVKKQYKQFSDKKPIVKTLQLEKAYKYLVTDLNNIPIIKATLSNGTVDYIQGRRKGNLSYDFQAHRKYLDLSKALNHYIKVKGGCTNALFDTLTLPFNNIQDNHLSWKSATAYFAQYIRSIKKVLKIKHYICTLEAQENGQMHIHTIIILENFISYKKSKGSYFFRSQPLFKKIQSCWKYGHSKPMPVYNTNGAIYELAKYALKGNRNLKQSLNNYQTDKASSSDIKKINLFYYSKVNKVRTLRTSKNILDCLCNKSTSQSEQALKESILSEDDKNLVNLLSEKEPERKYVKIEALTNAERTKLRFYKNGCICPADWDNNLRITVNDKNEIIEQKTYNKKPRR